MPRRRRLLIVVAGLVGCLAAEPVAAGPNSHSESPAPATDPAPGRGARGSASTPPDDRRSRAPAELQVTVVDQTDAVLLEASVVLEDADGRVCGTTSAARGVYRVGGVPPGSYTLRVAAAGFRSVSRPLALAGGASQKLTVTLFVEAAEQVEVGRTDRLSTDPANNLSGLTLSGDALEALPANPRALLQRLLDMAGSRGRPSDVVVLVNGFPEARLVPPREAIDLIRINADPYSAEFAAPGSRRIEIITKPGAENVYGLFGLDFGDEALQARNAFAAEKIPSQVRSYRGFLGAPLVHDRWGLLVYAGRWEQDETAVVNATVLDRSLRPERFRASVRAPERTTNVTLQTGYDLGAGGRLGVEYSRGQTDAANQGLGGGFDLPSRAYRRTGRDDAGRITVLSTWGTRVVHEAGLQLRQRRDVTQAAVAAPAIVVLQTFNAGGNQEMLLNRTLDRELRLTDRLTVASGAHTLKFGYTLEGARLRHDTRSDFGGTFVFGADWERDASGAPIPDATGQPVPILPLESYRRTLLGLPGYRPAQFSITRGGAATALSQWEFGAFVQDDWRLSPQLTVSLGIRHELQTNLDDKAAFAPRVGLAWSPDRQGRNVVRLGSGVFYRRLETAVTLETLRLGGTRQQRFILQRPASFPAVPANLRDETPVEPTTYSKAPGLAVPSLFVSSVSYERQLSRQVFGSLGYTFERGRHLLRSRNINAPARAEAASETAPIAAPALQFESTGRSRRHEVGLALRATLGSMLRLTGNYTLAWTHDDTDGPHAMPADSFDLAGEFGRASRDERHQAYLSATVRLRPGTILIPSITVASGRPFNITTGLDNNRDSLFTDRPARASPSDAGAIVTRFGAFNPQPGPHDLIIPRNLGTQPGHVNVGLSLSQALPLGRPQRYVVLSASADNLLNTTNFGGFNGVLTSPSFGQPNWSLPARRMTLSLELGF